MKLGFTGSRNGMTLKQKAMLSSWISMWLASGNEITEAHHGCCVGADDEFHQLCMWYGFKIILHPPDITDKIISRHLIDVPDCDIRQPDGYLARDRKIVEEVDFLVGAPAGIASKRGGTWYTLGYAQKIGREHRVLDPT